MSQVHTAEAGVSLTEHPEFLALLENDEFRQELKARPSETLSKFGIDTEGIRLPSSVRLPQQAQPTKTGIRSGFISKAYQGLF